MQTETAHSVIVRANSRAARHKKQLHKLNPFCDLSRVCCTHCGNEEGKNFLVDSGCGGKRVMAHLH